MQTLPRRPCARQKGAAQPRHRGVKNVDPRLQPRIGVGDAHAARIVQVQCEPQVRIMFMHRADDALRGAGRRPRHGVGELKIIIEIAIVRKVERLLGEPENSMDPIRRRSYSRTPP